MKIILILVLSYVAVILLKGLGGSIFLPKQPPDSTGVPGNKMVQDPICQLYIPRDRAIEKTGKEGPVYFCSQKCAEEYAKKGQPVG